MQDLLGFISAINFLSENKFIYGLDNINNYYDVGLKDRIRILKKNKKFFLKKLIFAIMKKQIIL